MEEAISILKEIRDNLENQNKPKMLRIADVADILGVNRDKAGKLWEQEGFPGIVWGHKQVEQTAFYNWLQMKREGVNYK